MDTDTLEKYRMDLILDLRNGRYDVKLMDVLDMLSSGLNDKPLLNEIIKAHEKKIRKNQSTHNDRRRNKRIREGENTMKFEIELDWIQTYKIIVDADCETTAEIAGDNIDMEEFDRQRRESFNYVGFQTIGKNAKLIK